MKSNRLTNYIKDTIIERVFTKVFGKRIEMLKKQKEIFADTCYEFRYDKKELNIMNELQVLTNNNAFAKSNTISLHFGGRYSNMKMSQYRPFFNNDFESKTKLTINHKLSIQWQKLQDEESDINSEKKKLGQEIRSLLNSVNTTKQLLEVWPESEIFLKGLIEPNGKMLPMVQVKTLNEVIFNK